MVNIQALLDALPWQPMDRPSRQPRATKKWSWDEMRPYNGFVHAERVRLWQLTWALVDQGVIRPARTCDICGSGNRVTFHAEDYYNPFTQVPICAECHKALHRRTYQPAAWVNILNYRTEAPGIRRWYHALPMDREPDVAAFQRARYPGRDLSDFARSPLFNLFSGAYIPDDLLPVPPPPSPEATMAALPLIMAMPLPAQSPAIRLRKRPRNLQPGAKLSR